MVSDPNQLDELIQNVVCSALGDVRREIQELRAERQHATDQLFASIQFLTEMVQMVPLKQLQPQLQPRSHTPPDVESYRGSPGIPGLHEMPPLSELLQVEPDLTPTKRKRMVEGGDGFKAYSHSFSSEIAASSGIPTFNDLEKRMLRQVSSSQSLRPGKGTPGVRRLSGASSMGQGSSEAAMQPVVPPAAPAQQIGKPGQPEQAEPPMLEQVSKAKTTSGPMTRRGSAFQHLTRDSQTQILTVDGMRSVSVCEIFLENIGVSLWLKCSNSLSFLIFLLNLCHLVLSVILYARGEQQSGEQWTAMSLLLFSAVAILLLQLVKRSLCSEDLNLAIQKLDNFVQDCGHGLDWSSVARKHWCHFVSLWAAVLFAFVIQQVLEVWVAGFLDWSIDAQLRVLKAGTGFVLFAVSSAVVMNGAYFQFNLLLGLGKTLDCWCADMIESSEFISGIKSWNSLQALLKCIGREVTPCFTALNLIGYVGFFASLAGSFSLLLDDEMAGWKVALYELALLPLLYLFFLSANLFAKGAWLSEKCRQIPAFVNQLRGEGADTDRQYLVRYISDSAAGFIIHGVTLSQNVFLRQLHFLTAIVSGFTGILVRRYL